MNSPAETHSGRRSFKLLGWAALPVLVLAGIVQISGAGIDILLVAAAGLVLLGLERSVGDWLGEWFGPLAAAIIFVAASVALSWFFLADSLGRSQTDRFFVEAERRGYRTVYYQTPRSSVPRPLAAADASGDATPVATGGRDGRVTAAAVAAEEPAASPTENSEETNDSNAERDGSKAESAGGNPVLSWFRRGETKSELTPTNIEVSVSPARVSPGRRTIITATVRVRGSTPSGSVDFTVNGLGAGRVPLNAKGVASTTFRTYIAGTHEVRARYTGSGQHSSSRSSAASLTVTARESPD